MSVTDTVAWLHKKASFSRGIHPADRKSLSRDMAIEVLPTPNEVVIPLQQHAGAPAQVVVKPRQDVVVGDLIGDAGQAPISANIHASMVGKVQALTGVTLPNGRQSIAIPIKPAPAKPAGKPGGAAAGIAALDLFTKAWAFARVARGPARFDGEAWRIPAHDPVPLIPGVLGLKLTTNTGAVFGLGEGGQALFVAVTFGAVGLIGYAFWHTRRGDWISQLALGLLLQRHQPLLHQKAA